MVKPPTRLMNSARSLQHLVDHMTALIKDGRYVAANDVQIEVQVRLGEVASRLHKASQKEGR